MRLARRRCGEVALLYWSDQGSHQTKIKINPHSGGAAWRCRRACPARPPRNVRRRAQHAPQADGSTRDGAVGRRRLAGTRARQAPRAHWCAALGYLRIVTCERSTGWAAVFSTAGGRTHQGSAYVRRRVAQRGGQGLSHSGLLLVADGLPHLAHQALENIAGHLAKLGCRALRVGSDAHERQSVACARRGIALWVRPGSRRVCSARVRRPRPTNDGSEHLARRPSRGGASPQHPASHRRQTEHLRGRTRRETTGVKIVAGARGRLIMPTDH